MYIKNTSAYKKAFKLAENQGYLCFYCGIRMVLLVADDRRGLQMLKKSAKMVTLDHIKPAADGGHNHTDNMVAACSHCNNIRQDYPHELFKALIVQKGMDWGVIKKVCKEFHRLKHAYKTNIPKVSLQNGTQRRRGWGAYEAPGAVPIHRRSPQSGSF